VATVATATTPDRHPLADVGDEGREHQLPAIARFYNFPALSFHYSIPPSELAVSPNWLLKMYQDALPALIQAQHLQDMEACAYPYLKEKDAERLLRRVHRAADAWPPEEVRRAAAARTRRGAAAPSPQTARMQLAAAGIGMTILDKDGNVVTPGEVTGRA